MHVHEPGDSFVQGSDCPLSGFCGVPECGTWSSGALDRGTPCTGGIGPAPDPSAPQAAIGGPARPADFDFLEILNDETPAAAEAPASIVLLPLDYGEYYEYDPTEVLGPDYIHGRP